VNSENVTKITEKKWDLQANFRKQCEAALFGIYDIKRKYVKHMEIFVSKLCAYDDISEKNLQLHCKNTVQQ